jgi:hypothetical protein
MQGELRNDVQHKPLVVRLASLDAVWWSQLRYATESANPGQQSL